MNEDNTTPVESGVNPIQALAAMMQGAQSDQQQVRHIELRLLAQLVSNLNDQEFYIFQHDLQSVVYSWLRKKGLITL